MKQHDQQCTPMRDNLSALWQAVRTFGRIGHELKNVVIEAWRHATGQCPKEPKA